MDGDSCHHIRRACKKFTKIFDEYLEQLYQDIYNDFKWSEDIRVILEDIFECLCVSIDDQKCLLLRDGCRFMTSLLEPYICSTCMLFFISHF